MGYGYPLQAYSRRETIGLTVASGVLVSGSATGGVYGSLTTIGTTGFAYDGLFVVIQSVSGRRWRLTLTANTNSTDEPIATDFYYDNNETSDGPGPSFWLPIFVPSGATLKLKAAGGSSGSGTLRASIIGYQGDGNLIGPFTGVVGLTDFGSTTSGCDVANPITLTGTTPTGWFTMQAATPAAVSAISLCINTMGQAITSGDLLRLDLGYGTAGNEIATGISLTETITSGNGTWGLIQNIPIVLPAGLRLAMRATLSAADTTHTVGLVGWGLVR